MLGDNIRSLRKLNGLTETELANAVGVKQPYINKIEKNEKVPLIPLLQKIATALSTTVQDLLENSNTSAFNASSLKILRGNMTYEEFSEHLEKKGVEAVGQSLFIKPQFLKEYEKGTDVPPEPVLKYIAIAKGVDANFFYNPSESPGKNEVGLNAYVDLSFMDEEIRKWVSNPQNITFIKLMYQAFNETKRTK